MTALYIGLSALVSTCGNVLVLDECGEGNVRPAYVPHVDGAVDDQGAVGNVVLPLRPPFHVGHRSYRLDALHQQRLRAHIPNLQKSVKNKLQKICFSFFPYFTYFRCPFHLKVSAIKHF